MRGGKEGEAASVEYIFYMQQKKKHKEILSNK